MCSCRHDCCCRQCTDQRNIEAGLGGALLLVGGVFLAGWAIYKIGKGAINLLASTQTPSKPTNSPNLQLEVKPIRDQDYKTDAKKFEAAIIKSVELKKNKKAKTKKQKQDVTTADKVKQSTITAKIRDIGLSQNNSHNVSKPVKCDQINQFFDNVVIKPFKIKNDENVILIPKGYKLNIKIYNLDPVKFRVMADGELIHKDVLLLADLSWFIDHINTEDKDYPEAVC